MRCVFVGMLGLLVGACRAEPNASETPASSKTAPTASETPDPDPVAARRPTKDKDPAKPATPPEAASCDTVESCIELLETQSDRDVVVGGATALAKMDDPRALEALRTRLGDAAFLAKLDDVTGSPASIDNVRKIFGALRARPSSRVAELCLQLGRDPEFLAVDERLLPLLQTLAAVEPMSEEAAAFFAAQNPRGYASSNALLLGQNASPKALELFSKMLYAPGQDVEEQIDTVREALLSVRTDADVIEAVSRWLRKKNPKQLEVALVEVMFDYQPARWYGKRRNFPTPPPWSDASPDALRKALELAKRYRDDARMPPALRKTIEATSKEIRAALAQPSQ